MTFDIFPSWEAFGKGLPTRALWNTVHPERDTSAAMTRLTEVRDRPRVDTVKLIEVMMK